MTIKTPKIEGQKYLSPYKFISGTIQGTVESYIFKTNNTIIKNKISLLIIKISVLRHLLI